MVEVTLLRITCTQFGPSNERAIPDVARNKNTSKSKNIETLIVQFDINQYSKGHCLFTRSMETYCIFFIDREGHVLNVEEIVASCDHEAIDHVRKRYECGTGKGYELWKDDRRIDAHFDSRLSHH